jgi:hypothetical protein
VPDQRFRELCSISTGSVLVLNRLLNENVSAATLAPLPTLASGMRVTDKTGAERFAVLVRTTVVAFTCVVCGCTGATPRYDEPASAEPALARARAIGSMTVCGRSISRSGAGSASDRPSSLHIYAARGALAAARRGWRVARARISIII